MQITFCSANYVARAANHALKPFNWGEAERLTVERMTPEEFDAILSRRGCRRIPRDRGLARARLARHARRGWRRRAAGHDAAPWADADELRRWPERP